MKHGKQVSKCFMLCYVRCAFVVRFVLHGVFSGKITVFMLSISLIYWFTKFVCFNILCFENKNYKAFKPPSIG